MKLYQLKIKKTLSYHSVSNNPFIDEHLRKDIVAMDNYREVTIKSGDFTFNLHIHYFNVLDLDLLVDTLGFCFIIYSTFSTTQSKRYNIDILFIRCKKSIRW